MSGRSRHSAAPAGRKRGRSRSRSRSPRGDDRRKRRDRRDGTREREIARERRQQSASGELAETAFGSRAKAVRERKQREEVEKKAALVKVTDFDRMRDLGFPMRFGTTKNRQVPGNKWHAARIKSKRKYRQYLNKGKNRKRPGN